MSTECPANGYVAAGTACETGFCTGRDPLCPVTCTESASCNVPNACEVGLVDCSTGRPVCVSAGLQPEGAPCGTPVIGPWSACEFASECAEAGLRTREVSSPTCDLDGTCGEGIGQESEACFRDTDGAACAGGPGCVAGVCGGSEGVCAGQPSGTVCRPAAGPCDQPESCDGVSATCPPDGFLPATTACRAAASECDAAEFCTGANPACPADEAQPFGTPCSRGFCDGLSCVSTCESDAPCSLGDPCIVGAIDCAGGVPTCTATGDLAPDGTSCGTPIIGEWSACVYESDCGETGMRERMVGTPMCNSGACTETSTIETDSSACLRDTEGQACDGGPNCIAGTCGGRTPGPCTGQPPGTVCRASTGVCDVAEACDGASDACPPDDFRSSETICRSSAGECDVQETCTGDSAACPTDGLAPRGTPCRGGMCTGSSISCNGS
ncbi:MAG: hypothetical protein AAF645_10420 [Myxococcota bacterium]